VYPSLVFFCVENKTKRTPRRAWGLTDCNNEPRRLTIVEMSFIVGFPVLNNEAFVFGD